MRRETVIGCALGAITAQLYYHEAIGSIVSRHWLHNARDIETPEGQDIDERNTPWGAIRALASRKDSGSAGGS